MTFKDKVVVVTGGAQGIVKYIAISPILHLTFSLLMVYNISKNNVHKGLQWQRLDSH